MNYFNELNAINCNDKTEQKNGLTYLSWAWAWTELKKKYPLSYYTIYENERGWNYFTDGHTCWVKTGVTVVIDNVLTVIDGKEKATIENPPTKIEHIEYLPVMDFKNKSIPYEAVTSFDVNKAIQRSLTKAVARHGLGLYIYAGEDLPSEKDGSVEDKVKEVKAEKEIKKKMTEGAVTEITEAQKQTLKDTCEELNINLAELLKSVGWVKEMKVTSEMYGKAMNILIAERKKKNE